MGVSNLTHAWSNLIASVKPELGQVGHMYATCDMRRSHEWNGASTYKKIHDKIDEKKTVKDDDEDEDVDVNE